MNYKIPPDQISKMRLLNCLSFHDHIEVENIIENSISWDKALQNIVFYLGCQVSNTDDQNEKIKLKNIITVFKYGSTDGDQRKEERNG